MTPLQPPARDRAPTRHVLPGPWPFPLMSRDGPLLPVTWKKHARKLASKA